MCVYTFAFRPLSALLSFQEGGLDGRPVQVEEGLAGVQHPDVGLDCVLHVGQELFVGDIGRKFAANFHFYFHLDLSDMLKFRPLNIPVVGHTTILLEPC